ncbi:MAG: hypothetical protein O3B65_00195 [Chloroflexi bacterium]|nr:hypothetical protein [Chloroflexota bacterium]
MNLIYCLACGALAELPDTETFIGLHRFDHARGEPFGVRWLRIGKRNSGGDVAGRVPEALAAWFEEADRRTA